jgi:hypothetical protein
MTEKNPAYVISARTDHAADSFRLMMAGLAGRSEGVFGPNDLLVTQDTGSNMNSRVSAGGAFMYGDANVTQGVYSGYNDANKTLTHGAAPGTAGQSRRDLVCARTQDAQYAGATNAWDLRIIAGTASASPSDPALGNNEIALARVTVAFGQTTITNANITDLRPRMFASGGIAVVNSARRPGVLYGPMSDNALASPAAPGAEEGMGIYETDTDKLQFYSGTAWVPRGNIVICTSSTRPTAFEGLVIYETDNNVMAAYNGSAWIQITPEAAEVLTSQGTTSSAYTDLATVGPAVTLTTGTKAVITIHSQLNCNQVSFSNVSFAVSGATTLAADDTRCLSYASSSGGETGALAACVYLSTLTPGVNTFTLKYRAGAGTSTFTSRRIVVQALP